MEKKEEGSIAAATKRAKKMISMGKFLSTVSGAPRRQMHHLPSQRRIGLKDTEVPAATEPIFFSKLFVTDKLIDEIVYETNHYAQTVINSK